MWNNGVRRVQSHAHCSHDCHVLIDDGIDFQMNNFWFINSVQIQIHSVHLCTTYNFDELFSICSKTEVWSGAVCVRKLDRYDVQKLNNDDDEFQHRR